MEDITKQSSFEKQFTLAKSIPMEIKLQKYKMQNPSEENTCALFLAPSPLEKNEQVLIRLTQVSTENGILSPPPIAVYLPGNTTILQLLPGEYEADLTLIRNEAYPGEMTVKKDSQSKTIPAPTIFEKDKVVYYPDKDIIMPSIMTGGAVFTFKVSENDLKSNILFTIFDAGTPKQIEDVGIALQKREVCYNINKNTAAPRFS